MKTEYINSWLDSFSRQSLIRRAMVVSGNIIDISFSTKKELKPVNHIVTETLKNQGFQHVVYYSRVGGVSGITPQQWQDLQSMGHEQHDFGGEDYDMDMSSHQSPQSGNTGQTELTPKDFFAVAEQVVLKSNLRVAFIVDWSNYLFGQVNSLSDAERAWLQQVSKSIRDADLNMSVAEMNKPQSLFVFMCAGSAVLPPSLYLNNPLFSEIHIPLPSIKEREQAIASLNFAFQVQQDLSPASQGLRDFVTLTDGLMIRDIYNLARLSRQQENTLSIHNLVSLYQYGKRNSPWEQLNHSKLQNTKSQLQLRVKGQDQALDAVNKILIRAYTGLSGLQHSAKAKTPKGALFFVGPTGVGKTELAKTLAEFLFGDEDACIRFDMSEFNHEHADQRLVGAPPGYVGYEQGGQLTNAVKSKPFSLLLFDEIEKAHPRILDKFLQILEDGRLTDGKGETISFSDTFIVFTSNIGASDISPSTPSDVAEQFKIAVQTHFKEELKRPELLGRIGEANIIPFNFMSDNNILKEIARAKLKPLENRLIEKWNIKAFIFENEDKALDTLVSQVNTQHGGRGVLNVLTKALFDPLADFLFTHVEHADQLKNRSISVIQAGRSFDFDII